MTGLLPGVDVAGVLRAGIAVLAGVVVIAAIGVAATRLSGRSAAAAPPWVAELGSAVGARIPSHWNDGLQKRLAQAGDTHPVRLHVAIALRFLTGAVATVLFVGIVTLGGAQRLTLVAGLTGALGVAAAPELALRRRIGHRRTAMRRDLPRHLDLLIISVEAGLGFDQAVDRVIEALPGALSQEFARMQVEVRAGVARGDALRSLVARCPLPDVRSFALAMIQADTFGVAVGPVLRTQADEIRVRHRQAVQTAAQKAPVKMLLPMVTCIFPALLVVIAGPALLSVRSVFPT